jgi:acetyl esterase/lipase
LNFVDGDEPPFLLLHGSADTTVWPANSELLARKLDGVGVEAVLRLYRGVGHSRILMALRFPRLAPVLDDTMGFIDAHRAALPLTPAAGMQGAAPGNGRDGMPSRGDSHGLWRSQMR